jgi:hypothetical protein
MKDFLTDIVAHTQALGVIDTIKVSGDDTTTTIESVSEDRSVILNATFNTANPEFAGVFGMPNLSKLNTILNIPEYRENEHITVTKTPRNGDMIPVGVHFENATGDFKNEYRFMTSEMVNEKLKSVKFKGTTWVITLEPTVSSITRLKFQSQANSEEKMFKASTKPNGDLVFAFGDHSTHAGEFVFQSAVSGKLNTSWSWPVGLFLAILNLQGDKSIQFSNDGVAKITVDSGLIKYEYLLPAKA